MFKKLIYRFLYHRHPWRALDFDELAELYTSMMLRSLAISLVGIFVPVYLYNLGYSLRSIMMFYCLFFLIKILWDYLAGHMVARFGPKHSMVIAYILQVGFLGMFASLSKIEWPLHLLATAGSGATSIFFIAYHTDFSKVKHSENGGRELGWMHMLERCGAMLGPVAGGVIAVTLGASYAFAAATVLFVLGLVPLFLSGEAVKTHQHLDFSALKLRDVSRDIGSFAALSVEQSVCLSIWPLFMAVFIFGGSAYGRLGLASSVGVVFSIISARAIGRTIDAHKGRALLRMASAINALLHLFRPFSASLPGAIGVNIVNESVTVAYRMPFMKGMYDAADDLPGRRIAYIVAMEIFSSVAKGGLYLTLFLLSFLISGRAVLDVAFLFAAVASLLIGTEKFRALDVGVHR